jgi:hypothetical protein
VTVRHDVGQDGFIRYRARQQDCGGCTLRDRCTPNMPVRKVIRSIHEEARDTATTRLSRSALYRATQPQLASFLHPNVFNTIGSYGTLLGQRVIE